jgi:hypothetical protein
MVCLVARRLKDNVGKYPGRGILTDSGGYKGMDRVIL